MALNGGIDLLIEQALTYGLQSFVFIVLLITGYILGIIVSTVLYRLLRIGELEQALIAYGAVTSRLWDSITSFLRQYIKWYVTIAALTLTEVMLIQQGFNFLTQVLGFIVLTVIGILAGGVLAKAVKGTLLNFGMEEFLRDVGVDSAIGGRLKLSDIISGIVKWYFILLFLQEGANMLNLPILSSFLSDFVNYVPEAVMGGLLIIVALLIAKYLGNHMRQMDIGGANIMGAGIEMVIIFFGVVLALPNFGVRDVEILKQSFLILTAGVALGLGIALGWGLKDVVARAGEKYEREQGRSV